MANTCREAVEEAFAGEKGVLDTAQVIDRIYKRYPDRPWKPNAISAHLIGLSVNHSSSIHHPTLRKHGFLFSLGNGRYRRWDPAQDGRWDIVDGRVQLIDSSAEPEVAEDEAISEVSAVDTSLSLERDMERTLLRNLAQLEQGLQLYERNGISGNQLDTGAVGRLDILAVDNNGSLVVVELKAGRADDRVCGQILRYIGWVKENLAGDRTVRGIVVANDFSEALRFAAKAMSGVSLKRYEVRFDFTDVG
jgi:hypothetical protein